MRCLKEKTKSKSKILHKGVCPGELWNKDSLLRSLILVRNPVPRAATPHFGGGALGLMNLEPWPTYINICSLRKAKPISYIHGHGRLISSAGLPFLKSKNTNDENMHVEQIQ
jgi:hypothetical protein